MTPNKRNAFHRGDRIVRFISYGTLIILLLFAAILTHSTTVMAQASQSPAQQTIPGVTNLDVVLVIDQSGSMWDRNDIQVLNPDGSIKTPSSRIVAAELLGEWLATDQSGAHHQLGVIMFGYDAQVVFPLQEIQSPQAQAAYKKALIDGNKPMGGTNILEALQLAKAELDKGRSGPDVRKALIFLSDGVCEPVDNTTDALRQQCEQDIRTMVQSEFGADKAGSIFTIALSSDAFKQDPANRIFKNLWQEMSVTTGGDYYEPAAAGAALLDSFVKIMQRLFGLPIQSPPAAVDAPATITVTLQPALQQVGFTLIKYGQGISMTLTRPDRTTIDPSTSGVRHSMSEWTESYNITRPPGGQWVANILGNGKVVLITVPFAQKRYTVERTQPANAHPQGKPMDIQVSVLKTDLAPQTVNAFQVSVQAPDGITTKLPVTAVGASYRATLTNTEELGTYSLDFSGSIQDDTLSAQQSVRVVTAPWLRIVDPQPGAVFSASAAIPVRVQVMLNTNALEAPGLGNQLEAVVRLLDPAGQVSDMQLLHPVSGGLYSGTITAATQGLQVAQAQLNYNPASGEKYQDIAQVPLDIKGVAPLVVPSTATSIPPTPEPTVDVTPNSPQPVSLSANLMIFVYALAGLGALVVISQLLLVFALRGLRKAFQQTSDQQDLVTHSRPGFETNLKEQATQGWQDVAAQVTADALHQTIAVDRTAGILDSTAVPCPRFTIITSDGREVIYTTDPRMLRQMKLIRRQDQVVDVSAISKTRHVDAGMLWHYAMVEHGRDSAFPPSSAHWYVVVRKPGARTAGMQAMRRPRGWLTRLFKSHRGGRS